MVQVPGKYWNGLMGLEFLTELKVAYGLSVLSPVLILIVAWSSVLTIVGRISLLLLFGDIGVNYVQGFLNLLKNKIEKHSNFVITSLLS